MTAPLRTSSDPYLAAADQLVDELLPLWKDSDNVWRAGWVLDTLIDYFVARSEDGSVIERPLLPVSPTKQGDWWDDFAWVGIATLRAAELGIFPDHRNELVKAAINAWAYMHGPGWSKTPTDRAFPFTDLEGWESFHPSADRKIGAPNSWSKIRETWTQGEPSARQVGERRPRYSPGGVWNAPIRDQDSPKVVSENPDCPPGNVALAPVQNTVTNGLYAILSLRLAMAGSGAFRDLFDMADLDLSACKEAWTNQLNWFVRWIYETGDEESLALTISPTRFLVRERVSTFDQYGGQRAWDGGYCSRLVWTGDQGLLLGFLREVEQADGGAMPPSVVGAYRQIISTVFERAYAPRRYSKAGPEGMFMLPWLRLGDDDRPVDPYDAPPPGGGDYGDYQTGNGVFMRYLLQAYRVDPTVVGEHGHLVTDSAKLMAEKRFGESVSPPGCCDAYMSIVHCGDTRPANRMSPLVNRLAVLLMAHEMTSGAAG